MKRLTAVGFALVLAAAAACGGGDSSGTISGPTGTVVTDTFNGTVPLPVAGVLQVDVHNFNVAVAGTVSVTLVSAGPPPTITMGLAIGNPGTTGTCSIISNGSTATPAGTAAQLTGTLAAGAYCVVVGDLGNALQPIAYTVTVAHT
jgi:hypothetical protein